MLSWRMLPPAFKPPECLSLRSPQPIQRRNWWPKCVPTRSSTFAWDRWGVLLLGNCEWNYWWRRCDPPVSLLFLCDAPGKSAHHCSVSFLAIPPGSDAFLPSHRSRSVLLPPASSNDSGTDHEAGIMRRCQTLPGRAETSGEPENSSFTTMILRIRNRTCQPERAQVKSFPRDFHLGV